MECWTNSRLTVVREFDNTRIAEEIRNLDMLWHLNTLGQP